MNTDNTTIDSAVIVSKNDRLTGQKDSNLGVPVASNGRALATSPQTQNASSGLSATIPNAR